jgi:predicted dehydrogenase
MRFPGERVATFTVGYNGGDVDEFRVVGAKGDLFSQPAYQVGTAAEHTLTVRGKKRVQRFPRTDQFGGELKYFSQCILEDREPEPNGEEGMLDVRVIEAIENSLRTGRAQKLEPYVRSRRVTADQVEELRPVREPELIGAKKPDAA